MKRKLENFSVRKSYQCLQQWWKKRLSTLCSMKNRITLLFSMKSEVNIRFKNVMEIIFKLGATSPITLSNHGRWLLYLKVNTQEEDFHFLIEVLEYFLTSVLIIKYLMCIIKSSARGGKISVTEIFVFGICYLALKCFIS